MKKNIQIITATIPYKIIRSDRRRTSEIQVGENGIEVRVPMHKKDNEVMDMIHSRQQWIYKKYLEFQTEKKGFKSRVGRPYIERRVDELAVKVCVKPSKLFIRPLKTRWGSATSNGTITINSRLFKAPKSVIDYVIIHELCHLKIPGHSRTYWSLVEVHMPNYMEKIKWLKKYGRFI